jgi:hypothetical protein
MRILFSAALLALCTSPCEAQQGTPDVANSSAQMSTNAWKIQGPSGAISLRPSDRVAITVIPLNGVVRDIRVIGFDLVEQTRRTLISTTDVRICVQLETEPSTEHCASSIEISTARMLWLRPAENWPSAGHYIGSLVLASSQTTDGESVMLDISLTTPRQQVFGTLAIFLGVAIAWVVSQWGRTRHSRGQLLLPAAFMRERLNRIEGLLQQGSPTVPSSGHAGTSKRLAELLSQLTDVALEQARFIPPKFPSPFGTPSLDATGYKAFLERAQAWADSTISVIVAMREAAGELPDALPEKRQKIQDAIASLDAITGKSPPLSPTDLAAQIAQILQPLQLAPTGGAAELPSSDQIQFQLAHTSVVVWWLVSVVTTLLGSYIVVFSNTGFGLWTDYIVCVLWGVGLPVGTALLQQTPNSVSQVLKVG